MKWLFFLLLASIQLYGFHAQKEYKAKDFSHLFEMKDFEHQLLEMHFTLYHGYVKNANFLLNELKKLADQGLERSYEFGAFKRRLGWEFDGMRLHELYFSNLGGTGRPKKTSSIYNAIVSQFGSFHAWKTDFAATGMIRGIGWVILYVDPEEKRLINTWINEHDTGHLSKGIPLLVMDVWEHAYLTQFGLDRAKYIQVFFENIEWDEVNERFMVHTHRDSRTGS